MLVKALREHLKKEIQFTEIDAHVNDGQFVDACVNKLITYMEKERKTP